MKLLVACEFSGKVRDAFIARGHDAISCDLRETESPGPHYKGDVKDILYSENWDCIIAHPDCTYNTNAGVRWLFQDCDATTAKERMELMKQGVEFFNLFVKHPCKKKAIENPVPHKYAGLPKYTQTIQPWQFGHTTSKRTCLWLWGLPKLKPTKIIPYHLRTQDIWLEPPGPDRAKNRSVFFDGIADAMADQWGNPYQMSLFDMIPTTEHCSFQGNKVTI